MVGVTSESDIFIPKSSTQGLVDRRKANRLIDVLQYRIYAFDLFGRIRTNKILYAPAFVFVEIVDEQVEILIERWLRIGVKLDDTIRLIHELFAKFNNWKIHQ